VPRARCRGALIANIGGSEAEAKRTENPTAVVTLAQVNLTARAVR
jgi:hypothetical protein